MGVMKVCVILSHTSTLRKLCPASVPRSLAIWNRHPIVWNHVPNRFFEEVPRETVGLGLTSVAWYRLGPVEKAILARKSRAFGPV